MAESVFDMFPDFLGRAQRQNFLRIAAATPENNLAAKFFHKFVRLHVGGGNLYRVDNVNTGINPVGNVVVDRAA